MTTAAEHESRMLVDGELIGADSGRTFDNVNPATEEVLGQVADASKRRDGPGDRRRAPGLRRDAAGPPTASCATRCLSQLQDALESEREELREELILEVGCPRMTTHANQLDIPLEGALRYPTKLIDEFEWRTSHARGARPPRHAQHPPDLEGAGRRGRRHRAVELPPRGHAQQAGAGPGHRQHRDPQACARYAVERDAAGPAGGRADGLSRRRAPSGAVIGPSRRRGAHAVAQGRLDLVHRIDGRGQADHGEGRAATLKRVFLELGGKSATIVLDDADFATSVPSGIAVCFHAGQGCAIQTRMLLPRSRYEEGVEILKATLGSVAYGDPQRPDVLMGPVISAKQRDRVLGYIEKGVAEGATLALGGGRPGRPAEGVVRRADALHRRRQLHDDRPTGDLRAGARRHRLRGRRRRGAHRQRQRIRALRRRVLRFVGARAGRGGADPDREPRRQRWHANRAARHALRRATSTAGSAARTAWPGSTSTSRSSRWPGRRPNRRRRRRSGRPGHAAHASSVSVRA